MYFDISINYWAVLVSAIASMVIGSIWYGPLFQKPFSRAMGMDGMTDEQRAAMRKTMMPAYLKQFVASLVTFYVLAWLIGVLDAGTPMHGMQVAFWVWLGFVAPVQFARELWGGKMVMFLLGAGNMLVTLLAAGAIIGGWM